MKIVRNIKGIRIDWLKVAEACCMVTPMGPVIGPDGTIYALNGRPLKTGPRNGSPTLTEDPRTAVAA